MNPLQQEAEKPYEATLVIEFEDHKEASIVFNSISPDNKPLPQGLELYPRIDSNKIIFQIRCRRPIMSLLATLDDILRMSALAERIAKSVKA